MTRGRLRLADIWLRAPCLARLRALRLGARSDRSRPPHRRPRNPKVNAIVTLSARRGPRRGRRADASLAQGEAVCPLPDCRSLRTGGDEGHPPDLVSLITRTSSERDELLVER